MANSLEQNLIRRCKHGEAVAFGPLIKLYRKQLYSYLFRLFGNKLTADDAFQETLIKVWKGIEKYSEQQKFSSWLFTVAHNCAMDELRKLKNEKLFAEEDPDEQAGNDNPLGLLEKEELKKMISNAVETLTIKQKNVFLLRVESGFTFKEISEITNDPLNTVLSHMNYSLKKIKRKIACDYQK